MKILMTNLLILLLAVFFIVSCGFDPSARNDVFTISVDFNTNLQASADTATALATQYTAAGDAVNAATMTGLSALYSGVLAASAALQGQNMGVCLDPTAANPYACSKAHYVAPSVGSAPIDMTSATMASCNANGTAACAVGFFAVTAFDSSVTDCSSQRIANNVFNKPTNSLNPGQAYASATGLIIWLSPVMVTAATGSASTEGIFIFADKLTQQQITPAAPLRLMPVVPANKTYNICAYLNLSPMKNYDSASGSFLFHQTFHNTTDDAYTFYPTTATVGAADVQVTVNSASFLEN